MLFRSKAADGDDLERVAGGLGGAVGEDGERRPHLAAGAEDEERAAELLYGLDELRRWVGEKLLEVRLRIEARLGDREGGRHESGARVANRCRRRSGRLMARGQRPPSARSGLYQASLGPTNLGGLGQMAVPASSGENHRFIFMV